MARTTKLQSAGLDLLDRIFQNQLLVDLHFSEAERDALHSIGTKARKLSSAAGLEGLALERTIHWSLALVELYAADHLSTLAQMADMPCEPIDQNALGFLTNFEAAFILALADKQDGLGQVSHRVAVELVGEVTTMTATVRHRLAERVFAVEFPEGPLEVLAWLCEANVIVPAKFRGRREPRSLAAVSLRAVALWELDGIREVLPLLLATDSVKEGQGGRTNGGVDATGWLRNILRSEQIIGSDAASGRIVTLMRRQRARVGLAQSRTILLLDSTSWDTAARVHSVLPGLAELAYWDRGVVTHRGKTTSPIAAMMLAKAVLAHPNRTVYSAESGTTLAHDVVNMLAQFGLTLSADTVYRTYSNRHKAHMERTALYYKMLQTADIAFPFATRCPYQVWTAVIMDATEDSN